MIVINGGNLVGPWRQAHFRHDVVDAQAGAGGRAILSENLNTEKLVEKTNVSGNDDQGGDGWDLERKVLLGRVHNLEINRAHIDVEPGGLEFGRQRGT